MSDILLAFGSQGLDLQLAGGDLLRDGSLATAVLVSLFTNRLADPGDELPADETDRQGWWADATLPGVTPRLGSRLWLLRREKQLASVLAKARQYAEEALAWLVEERRVRSLSVTASNPSRGVLLITVSIILPDGDTLTLAPYYDYLRHSVALTV